MEGLLPESDDDEQYLITEDDDLPFACYLCREEFKNPVVTPCMHYFCESCIISHSRSDSSCPVCGKKTGGVFNIARKLIAKLKKDKEMQKNEEEGGGDEEDEG